MSGVPGVGVCEITWPCLIARELIRLTVPTVQALALMERMAAGNVCPFRFGTRHGFGVDARLKVAVIVVSAASITIAQVPVPVQTPQPAKVDPAAGVAVNVTSVPAGYAYEQTVPQLIPAGELARVPDPVPFVETWSVTSGGSPPISRPNSPPQLK